MRSEVDVKEPQFWGRGFQFWLTLGLTCLVLGLLAEVVALVGMALS